MHQSLLGDLGEDVAGVEQQVLVAVVLDLGAAVLREDDDIAYGDIHGDALAVIIGTAWAGCDDLAFLRLFLGGVWDDQARSSRLLGLQWLNEDPVLERLDRGCHVKTPFMSV